MPVGHEYKPSKAFKFDGIAWDITDEEWECWMLEFLYGSARNIDPQIFNSWWFNKIRFEAIQEMVPEEIVIPPRRGSRFKKKRGIAPWLSKPVYSGSIASYGGLHFGSDFGFHKELKPDPRGRKGHGMAGSFVLILSCGREWNEEDNPSIPTNFYRCGDKKYSPWRWNDAMAASYAIMEEAEKRGDTFTLVMGPRAWERYWDDMWFDSLQTEFLGKDVAYTYYRRDGEPYIGQNNLVTGEWKFDPTRYFISMGIAGGRNRQNSDQYDVQLRNCDVGSLTETIPCVSPVRFAASTDYDAIKDFMLRMPYNENPSNTTLPNEIWYYVQTQWPTFSKTTRGTIIYITKLKYPMLLTLCWKVLDFLSGFCDIFVFDISDINHNDAFFGPDAPKKMRIRPENAHKHNISYPDDYEETEQLMMKAGNPLFTYIHVPDVALLTQSVLEAMRGQVR